MAAQCIHQSQEILLLDNIADNPVLARQKGFLDGAAHCFFSLPHDSKIQDAARLSRHLFL